MVWHIFRKDLKLFHKPALGVFSLYVLKLASEAGNRNQIGRVELASLAGVVFMAAMALLVVIMVQSDAVPGVRQDWLVRPLRRKDLLLAKIAFVLLAIQLPVFIADFFNGLAIGFPAGLALNAAFGQDFRLLFGVLLPVTAFATLTASLIEALAGAVAITLGVILFNLSTPVGVFSGSGGVVWIPGTIESALVLLGACCIAALQYYRRKTLRSRVVCGLTALLALSAQFLAWGPVFAIQASLSPHPEAARAVQIRIATGDRKPVIVNQDGLLANMDLPLDITGVGPDETLVDDRTESRIVERDGAIHPLAQTTFDGHSLSYGDRFTVMTIPRVTLQAGTARLEIDYWLTLMRMISQQSLPANGAEKLLDGYGVCSTSTELRNIAVPVHCRLGATPALMRWSLEGTSSPPGRSQDQNWPGDYSPFPGSGLVTRQTRFGLGMRDRYTWEKALSEIKISRVVMKAYEPVAHFRRHLSMPVSQLAP